LNLPQFSVAAGLPGRAPEDRRRVITDTALDGREGNIVNKRREIVMILDLHRQGLSVSAIARRTNVDRKTIRKYIERGLEAPAYGNASRERPANSPLSQRYRPSQTPGGSVRNSSRRTDFCRPSLLIVDEIDYLPVIAGGGNLFFQLVNAR
jgi:hypothetical protein